MLRVLAIVHFSAFGGPHNRTAQVAHLLRAEGVHTIIGIPSEPGTAFDRLRSQGLEVHRLPLERIRRTAGLRTQARTLRSLLPAIRATQALIREEDIDLVALNALGAPHLGLAARLERTPLVWQLIDTYPHPAVRSAFMPLVRKWADAVMTTGYAVAEQHPGAASFGDRLFNFFPCVDMHRFSACEQGRVAARSELGIHDGEKVVGTVGNLGPMKGHRTFLHAAAAVKRQRPRTRFVLLGATNPQFDRYWRSMLDLAKSLGLRVGNDLIITDPGDRVAELAQAFDVFWMTSEHRSEGIPTVIGEALALEIPVVAGRVGAIDECILDGVTGYLVTPVDSDAMVQPTLRLLDDDALSEVIGAAGREFAKSRYAAEIGARQHLRAYEAAIAYNAIRRRSRSASQVS